MSQGKLVITGATGLIGAHLVRELRGLGWEVSRLLRQDPSPGSGDAFWDPAAGRLDPAALEGATAIIHLAGANLADVPWTRSRKRLFWSSRVESTRLLAETMTGLDTPPVLLTASGVGFYGDRGEAELAEDSGPGTGFLAELCQAWEAAAAPAAQAGARVINLRLGPVLAAAGGFLPRLAAPVRCGLGATLGSGAQYVSWVAMADVVGIVAHVLATPDLSGPVNAVAPEPVTQAALVRAIGRVLRRPTMLRVPAFALELALGEMAREMLLSSTRAKPAKLLASGYHFRQPGLEAALRAELLGE